MSFNNFTGLNIVPTNEWTMDLKGAKQIKMVGWGDKRQITALLSVSKSGHLLKKKSNDNEERQSVKRNLRTSVVKPLHAKWVIKCHQKFEKETDFIKRSFEAIGVPVWAPVQLWSRSCVIRTSIYSSDGLVCVNHVNTYFVQIK